MEEQDETRRVGFYYTLTRAAAPAFPTNPLLRPFLDVQLPAGLGMTFDEEMVGWYFPGILSGGDEREASLEIGRRIPAEGAVPCSFQLRMTITDLNEFIEGSAHEARPSGTLRFDSFEGSTPAVFTVDENQSVFTYLRVNTETGEAEMRYLLEFQTPDQRRFVFVGRKYMQKDGEGSRGAIRDLLEDYTTLYVRVYRKTDAERTPATAAPAAGEREEIGTGI